MAKKKREFDRIVSKVGKAGELVADRQTSRKLQFVERPIIDDKKINVLVMGASGAGKSTLINAVLEEERAKVGDGAAVTKKMKVYERKDLPFRMIDTPGLEYSVVRQEKIKRDLAGWSEEGLTRKDLTKLVHAIWFCIDGQAKRVSKESLDYLYRISKLWEGVPIVVVFTKSYATAAIKDNEAMFAKVLKRYRKKKKLNVKGVVSVLAKELKLNENQTLEPYGVDELTTRTSELIPDAQEHNLEVMSNMSRRMRRNAAMKYVTAAKRSAFTVAVLPTRRADGEYLEPIQDSMYEKVAKAYVLSDSERVQMLESVENAKIAVKVGKALAKATKRVPLVNGFIAYQVTGDLGKQAVRSAQKLAKNR
ncbi:MAG: 50S ribosome-binding GTPase [Clostridia bacterium]|nr:50S ribosome-binding GTPase [Clostridia bacterium]